MIRVCRILFFLFLIPSLGQTQEPTPVQPPREKIFTYCAEARPISFNAQLATDGATFNASSRTMYNRLLEFEEGSTRIAPSLAERWVVSPSGKEITFYLRKAVEFHATDFFRPSRAFNADDVIFSFGRMSDPNHPFHKVGGGQYPTFQAQQMGQIVSRIEKVDDHTLKFILSRPEAPFLANLAMDFASILSAEYGEQLLAKKKAEDIDKLPIGTGPFVFVWYDKNKSIRYRAFDKYFAGRPRIDQLVFHIVSDADERLKKLQTNECQLIPEPSPAAIDIIKKDPKLKVMQQAGLNIAYLAMPVERMPFANILVRKAIHHALNREKYIKEIYGGFAQLAKNPIPPTMWSYNRLTQDYDYDVQKAKDYLKQAGLQGGFETEIWFADVSRPYNPSPKKMAQMVAADLAVVGIKVKLVELEWQTFLTKSRAGEPPLSIQGWTGDNGDPDNFLNNLLSCQAILPGNNRARWCNKQYSFLVDRARVTTSIRTRTKYYEDAQKIFKEEIPWVTLAHSIVFKAARKEVEGYRISPFGVDNFSKVQLK
jgi:dipeptide transport system substrate-binding protein